MPRTLPKNVWEHTIPQSQHTGMFSMLTLNAADSLMWIATNFYLAQLRWQYENEIAKPNPGRVWSCIMDWELWLQSQHLLQKYYKRLNLCVACFAMNSCRKFNFFPNISVSFLFKLSERLFQYRGTNDFAISRLIKLNNAWLELLQKFLEWVKFITFLPQTLFSA